MADSPNIRRAGHFLSWAQLADPSTEQCQRFLAESLAQLLSDLLRSILANASPAVGASPSMVERYRELAAACGATDAGHGMSLTISRSSLAKRCVAWLKLLLTAPTDANQAPAMREFVDALALFPSLFDLDPTARSRRARLTWLLTHDRRLDASTREAAMALIEACEHLGLLLWPDAETA
jgi:hypothetical protein